MNIKCVYHVTNTKYIHGNKDVTTLFKIALSYMVSKIIKSAFDLLNIKLPNRM